MKQETKSNKLKNKALKCLVAVVFAAIALTAFSSCAPIAGDTGGYGGGASPGGSASPSGDSSSSGGKFFSIKILAENGRSAGSRATVMYEPVVTWKTEQGFRSAVKEFSVQVGNESPQTVRLGDSITSRGTYAVGSEVTVSYEAYGDVNFIASDGSTTTRTEVIASETKIVIVAAQGTTVNFKVSDGLQTPENFPGESTRPEPVPNHVTYDWGEASRHGNKNGLPSDPTTYNEGDLFTVEDGSNMTWDHAAQQSGFAGWEASPAIEPANGGQATNAPIPGDDYKMPAGGVVLTAQWNKKTYQITYYANEPSNSTGSATITWGADNPTTKPTEVTALDSASVFSGQDPTSSQFDSKNWTFTGWNTDQNGTNGTPYSSGEQIEMMTEDITLYAQWTSANVYTVTYNIGSGPSTADSGWRDNDKYTVGTSPAITLPTLSATGYTFNGWQINGATQQGGTSYTPTASVTATAQWTVNSYRVTYSLDGGSGGPASGDVQYNASVSLDAPTKAGYNFTGWSYNGTTYGGTGNNSLTMPAQAITLTAQWTEMTTLYVSDSGNDTTGDGSNAKPFATVQKAITRANTLTGTDLTISISGTISVTTEITFSASGKTITVSGSGTLQRDDSFTSGSMIRVSQGTVKFNGPTLDGNNVKISEAGAVINISGSGVIVELVSGTIKNGATTNAGGGVRVGAGSTFKMSGGTITENDAEWGGGGVDVSGRFEMTSGTISKNRASGSSADGGGVNLNDQGVFTMENGSITENTCNRVGGGVKNNGSGATFTLNGGSITNNTASTAGGGVYTVDDNTFNGTGGTLSGNTPDQYGGVDYTGSSTGNWAAKDATIADTFWLLEDMGDFGEYRWEDYDSGNLDVQRPSGTIKVGASLSGFEPVCSASGGYPRQFLGWIETTDDSTAVEGINSAGDYLTTAKENMQAVFNW